MNTPIEFMKPRLVGERFTEHAIPFEVLKNLAVLEDLVIEAAKWKYLEAHRDRQRVPRGFSDGVALQLTEIREGSVIPVIALTLVTTTPLIPEAGTHLTWFEQGREAIFATVSAAEQQLPVSGSLPPHLLGYFDQLGRSLRDGEALELDPENPAKQARLTKESRRRILLQSDRIQELTEEVTLRGTVPEMDQEKMTFEFQVIAGQRVKATLEPQHLDTILEAFNGYRDNRKIAIRGIGRYNRHEKLLGLNAVEHVSALDELDPGARLNEFKMLKNGWLDGKGIAPEHRQLDWLVDAFDRHYSDALTLPYLYPTAEGGVQAEWSIGGWEISLEIALESHQGQWQALRMKDDAEESRTLNLNEPSDWQWFSAEIAKRAGGTVS